jgi:hypothetical protein
MRIGRINGAERERERAPQPRSSTSVMREYRIKDRSYDDP